MSTKFSKLSPDVVKAVSNCSFLPDHHLVVDFKSVSYYPDSDMLTQVELSKLSFIAEGFKLHYYVTIDAKGLCFRMYVPNLLF